MSVSAAQKISPEETTVTTRQAWTPEEIGYLKQNFGSLSIPTMAKALNRSYSTTHRQLEKMGLKRGKKVFGPEDHDFILKNWGRLSTQEIADHLNASKSVIYVQARNLGLNTTHSSRFWTEEEEAYLIKHWHNKSLPELQKHFNRSEACIRKKANNFGLRKHATPRKLWTDDELTYLKKHWGKEDVFEIAKTLNRTPDAIRRQAANLKLKRLRRAKDLKPWTPEEEAFLIEHWHSHSVGYLSRNLKKSVNAIHAKANRLKLGPKFDDGYTATEVSRILGYACGGTVVQWIEKGWLKAKRSRILSNRNYCITEKQLKSFMKAHPNLWSFERLTYDPFYDSNATWVNEKRKVDRQKFLDSLDAN